MSRGPLLEPAPCAPCPGIVRTLCEGVACYCPRAWVALISNPVNSTVPIAAEVFKAAGTYSPGARGGSGGARGQRGRGLLRG